MPASGGVYAIGRGTASSPLPFPTDHTLSALPAGGAQIPVLNSNTGLTNPDLAGIIFGGTTSGGNAQWRLTFTDAFVGKKILVYVTFGNNTYVVELQVWAPGTYIFANPGSGPSNPNAVMFGDPVPIFDDFRPPEPYFPPPPVNPFIPDLLVTIGQETGVCMLSAIITVRIHQIPTVNILSASVLLDGQPISGIGLAQLLAGVTFTDPGQYTITINYQYIGDGTPENPPILNPPPISQSFTISETPFPAMQRETRNYSSIYPGDPIVFPITVYDNSTIEYDIMHGTFRLVYCGDYFIKWFVVPEGGLTTDGANFALAIDGVADIVGSAHAKISPAVGFAIIKVDGMPPKVQLVNVSDGIVELSSVTQVKAGIVLFKIGDEAPII